jgi:inositol phosphorylceramide synthase catalytic subunit
MKKLKFPSWNTIAFGTILLYVSYLNFFVIKATPEIIFLQFIYIAVIYKKVSSRKFFIEWLPFILFFMLYEFVRGFADDLSPFGHSTLFIIYHLELSMFHALPTIYLQKLFLTNGIILNTALFFYSSFFYYSFLTGLLIWLFKPKFFKDYFKRFLLMSFVGVLCYFLFPTAPPWFVEDTFHIGIKRILYENTILGSFSGVSLYRYFVFGNAVAAFPSLHTAWTAFTSMYLIKNLGRKYIPTIIIPIMVGFSVVLTGEHFLLDVIAGFALAGFFIFVKLPSLHRLRKVFSNRKHRQASLQAQIS